MKARFGLFIFSLFIINVFCFYYSACFNIIYEKSSESWLQGALVSLVIDIGGMEMGLPLIQSIIRLIARKCSKLR